MMGTLIAIVPFFGHSKTNQHNYKILNIEHFRNNDRQKKQIETKTI